MSWFIFLFSLAQAEMWLPDSVTEQINWWKDWNDPSMVQLVEQGLENSPDVDIAWARVEQSKAMAGQLRAGFLPSVSLSASSNTQPVDALGFGFGLSSLSNLTNPGGAATEEDTSSDLFTSATMAINLGVPLDVWGSNTAAFMAGQKDAQASEEDRLNIMRQLSFAIANAYYDLILVKEQKEIIQTQVQLVQNILETTESRHKRGEATILDVLQQRQQLSSIQTQLIRISQQEEATQYRLALTIGEAPSYQIKTADSFPEIEIFGAAEKERWISERPDVKAAQYRLDAAKKRKYNAMTQVLPSFSVGGKLSRQANYQDDENDPWKTLDAWAVSTSASMTIFQGGGQYERVRSANAGVVMAEENLRKTKLQATQEVEQALLGEKTQQELKIAIEKQVNDARLAYQEAENRYTKGLAPFVTLLSTQQADRQAQLTEIQYKRDLVRARFQTFLTLGYIEKEEAQ